ncbi:MAG: hypothetical protein WDO15_27620 [Bacteroidota bacterium]
MVYQHESVQQLAPGLWTSFVRIACVTLTYDGKPVKASRLFLGHIHEQECNELSRRFGVAEEAYKKVAFTESPDDSFEGAYNTL